MLMCKRDRMLDKGNVVSFNGILRIDKFLMVFSEYDDLSVVRDQFSKKREGNCIMVKARFFKEKHKELDVKCCWLYLFSIF